MSSGDLVNENKHSKDQDNKIQQGQNVNQSPSEISVVPSTEGSLNRKITRRIPQ